MNFSDSVVLITGAAGALGRAVSAAFTMAGAQLVLLDMHEEGLQTAYPGNNSCQLLLPVNLCDGEAVGKAIAAAMTRFGRLDAVINIAGGFDMGPMVHETPTSMWTGMMNINVITLLNVVQAAVPPMLAAGRGKIVNIGAIGGVSGKPHMAAYSVAKSAVIRITEAMASELRDKGINVNCVLPSIIDTPANRKAMPDVDPGRWVSPDDLASVLLFLASDAARAVHGAAVPVTGLS